MQRLLPHLMMPINPRRPHHLKMNGIPPGTIRDVTSNSRDTDNSRTDNRATANKGIRHKGCMDNNRCMDNQCTDNLCTASPCTVNPCMANNLCTSNSNNNNRVGDDLEGWGCLWRLVLVADWRVACWGVLSSMIWNRIIIKMVISRVCGLLLPYVF